jgi:hypothetical protein
MTVGVRLRAVERMSGSPRTIDLSVGLRRLRQSRAADPNARYLIFSGADRSWAATVININPCTKRCGDILRFEKRAATR